MTKLTDFFQDVTHENSNKQLRTATSTAHLLHIVRNAYLHRVNDSADKMNAYKDSAQAKFLQSSKKSTDKYKLLQAIAEYSYKAIISTTKSTSAMKTTVTTEKLIQRAYTQKSLLHAVDVILQKSDEELHSTIARSIELANEKQAITKAREAVVAAQNNCHAIQRTIDALKDNEVALKAEMGEQLTKAEKTLTARTQLSDYVQVKSNRALIK